MNTSNPVLYTRVIPGTQLISRGVFTFECPVCKKQFRSDEPYEPACTGPSESRDDHPMQVMRLRRRDDAKIFSSVTLL